MWMGEDAKRSATWDRPLQWFVKDAASRVAHVLDYRCDAADTALCGHAFADIQWQGEERPRSVCRMCQEAMPGQSASEWERRAVAATAGWTAAEARGDDLSAQLRSAEQAIQGLRAEIMAVDSSGD